MRHFSIAVGLLCLALATPAVADEATERPLYMSSVLYERDMPLFFAAAAADSGDLVPPSPHPSAMDEPAADSASTTRTTTDTPKLQQPHIAIPLATSLVMGAGLAYALGWGGVLIAEGGNASSEDWDALALGATGFFAGEVVGVALGAHVGNGSRGSFGRDLGISFLSGLVAAGAASIAGIPGAIIGVGAQIYYTVRTERDRAAEKAREHDASR